jgi:hypothetical protein
VSYAVIGLVSVAVVDHVSFRLIVLLLVKFLCVNYFLSTNLSSFLLLGCRLLLFLCCLVLCGTLAAWSVLFRKRSRDIHNRADRFTLSWIPHQMSQYALCIHILVYIVTDLLSALLSNGSVNKPEQRDRFYVVRDATVATQRRSKQTHLCGNWSTRNNEKCVKSFLCSRRRGYITRHWWDARQFSVKLNEVTVLVPVFKSCRRELWRVLLWREDLCVIIGVWDSYSLCVESRC